MKRIVRTEVGFVILVSAATIAVVAATGAGAGATYLITFGFLAVALTYRLGPERVQLWREKHGKSPAEKP